MSDVAANLVEIFWSAQGEGPHVGRATVFVRFGGCDLRCTWCDSPGTWRPARRCRIAQRAGPDREVDEPVAIDAVADAIAQLARGPRDFVSLTGGEPLLQPEACAAIAQRARAMGHPVHLETHGLAVDALPAVLPFVDVVSMDWKLASDVRPAEPSAEVDLPAVHRRFLAAAAAAVEDVYVKVVVTEASGDAELDAVCAGIAAVAPHVPLVLQPVTPFGRVKTRPDADRMLALLERCAERVADVRVIPQTHPIYGAR